MKTPDPGQDLENDIEVEKVKPGCVPISDQVHEAPLGGIRLSRQHLPSSPWYYYATSGPRQTGVGGRTL